MSAVVLSAIRSDRYGSAQGFAVAWSNVVLFDFIVVIMTLVKVMQINQRSGKNHTLTHVLIRDGERVSSIRFAHTKLAVQVSYILCASRLSCRNRCRC